MINSILNALQRDGVGAGGKPKTKTLMILDEFATGIGYLQSVERGASYIAGFGVQMHLILQDLSQLKDLYDKRWETFLGNAGTLTCFANSDVTTIEYLSKRLGETQIVRTEITTSLTGNEGTGAAGFGEMVRQVSSEESDPSALIGPTSKQKGRSQSENRSPKTQTTQLMKPDEIASYFARKPSDQKDSEMVLVLMAGQAPMRLQKVFYYNDPILKRRSAAIDGVS